MFDHNYKDLNSDEKVNPHNLVCTAVSWNSTGNTLGVRALALCPGVCLGTRSFGRHPQRTAGALC
jgi:hypothetical protein